MKENLISILFMLPLVANADKLSQAAFDGDLSKVKQLLVTQKSQISQKDKSGNDALYYAVTSGYPEIALILISNGAVLTNKYTQKKTSILMLASEMGQEEVVRSVLKLNTKLLDQIDIQGESALFYSLRARQSKVYKLLVKSGANIQIKNKKGQNLKNIAEEEGISVP